MTLAARHIVHIQTEDFDHAALYAQVRSQLGGELGAVVSFVGLVRDKLDGASADTQQVATLTLEHYPGMTESSIENIVSEACERWPLLASRVVHRIGTLQPTEQIVLVVVASSHRDAAFAGAEFIMDYLKTKAVLWKREVTDQQDYWVESKQSDYQRAQSWHDDA